MVQSCKMAKKYLFVVAILQHKEQQFTNKLMRYLTQMLPPLQTEQPPSIYREKSH